ncbi:MAG: RluA family pseudouridine synthase [Clostridiales bacterium]|jgi:23S rRNA pseudouridine955/2504/2580 synthase|nr:RluA family pseudouridine synthase [Clostridiales bacterium]
MKSFIIDKNFDNIRLSKLLEKTTFGLPTSLMYKFIRKGKVRVDGKTIKKPDFTLCNGQKVDVYINDEFFDKNATETVDYSRVSDDIEIVYQDENILIANKPAGLSVHADEVNRFDNLINRAMAYLIKNGEYVPDESTFPPTLCHRIDRNTSGLVIIAKNGDALRIMNEIIKNRLVKKYYYCMAYGVFNINEETLHAYLLKKDGVSTVKVFAQATQGAKEIITKYKVLKQHPNFAELEVELITGRTHQIRAHMAFIGHPLIGDGKYGSNKINKEFNKKTQTLIAKKLEFLNDLPGLKYLEGKIFTI